jgi:hypothetical protein
MGMMEDNPFDQMEFDPRPLPGEDLDEGLTK